MSRQQQDNQAVSDESTALWHRDDPVSNPLGTRESIYRPEILDAIEHTVEALDEELRALSLNIHGESESQRPPGCTRHSRLTSYRAHPEIRFEEQ